MPYIKNENRDSIKTNVNNVQTPGDLNYLMTLAIVQTWMSAPCYETAHFLRRRWVTEQKDNSLIKTFRSMYADRFTVGDINTAAVMAYEEFARRVLAKYEDKKALINGDLPEYTQAIAEIDLIDAAHVKEAVESEKVE